MDEETIREFLIQHPDFFQSNPDLLPLLQIPHAAGPAVSLVERQVSVLRERNVDLRHRLRDLGSTARDNDELFADIRALVLELIPADSEGALEAALLRVLRDRFDIEYAALILMPTEAADESDSGDVALHTVLDTLIDRGSAGCGPLRAEQFSQLFSGARAVGSAAVAKIEHEGATLGVLAVGSADTARYGSGMGTLFIEFAAEVICGLLLRLRT